MFALVFIFALIVTVALGYAALKGRPTAAAAERSEADPGAGERGSRALNEYGMPNSECRMG